MIGESTGNPKKLTQTSIVSYFKYERHIQRPIEKINVASSTSTRKKKSIGASNTPKSRRRVSRESHDTVKKRQSMEASNTTVYLSSATGYLVEKRKLPVPIFSDDEDSEIDESTANALTKEQCSTPSPKKKIVSNVPSTSSSENTSANLEAPISNGSAPPSAEFLSTDFTTQVPTFLKDANKKNSDISVSVADTKATSSCSAEKASDCTKTPTASTSVSCSSNLSPSKKICVLNNVVITPPQKIQQKTLSNTVPKTLSNTSPKTLSNTLPKTLPKTKNIKTENKKINYDNLTVLREFFLNVLKTKQLSCLLSDSNKEYLHKFFDVKKNYQYVGVKLLLWKPIWYNVFKYVEKVGLQMDENEIIAMYNCLKDNEFVDTDYTCEDTHTLLNLLGLKELREIKRSYKLVNTNTTKDSIISGLLKICRTQGVMVCPKTIEQVLREKIEKAMGYCWKLSSRLRKCLYYVYVLNTFTNPSFMKPQEYFRDVSYLNFVFPTYRIEQFYIFYTEDEFLKYVAALELRTELESAIESKNEPIIHAISKCAFDKLIEFSNGGSTSFDTSRPPYLERFTATAQYIGVILDGSKRITRNYYEEVKIWFEYLIAQGYCRHKRGDWYCHLSLIYTEYLKDYENAAKLIISAFQKQKEHLSDLQLHELAFRGKILFRKTYNLPMLFHDQIVDLSPPPCDRDWPQVVVDSKTVRGNESGHKRTYIQNCENGDVNYLTVEQTALEHYKSSGYPVGTHCEGSIICALFCLLFWDIIYEDYVKGTFVSKVQTVPLDMYTKYFYINREKSIERRIHNINTGWQDKEFEEILMKRWIDHSHETALCPIDAVTKSPEDLLQIAMCIGRSVLSKIFERLVKNYRIYHSGFPDLIVWNCETKKAKFVEVKGENDKLSIKQKLWLNYLLDIEADVEVCHVHSRGSKKKLKF